MKSLHLIIILIFSTALFAQSYNTTLFGGEISLIDLTTLTNGKVVIVGVKNDDIYYQFIDTLGNKMNDLVLVNDYTNNRQEFPQISLKSNGGFNICWESLYQDDFHSGIFARVYDADGFPVNNEFQVNENSKLSEFHPKITTLKNDNFIICWLANDNIYARIFSEFGQPLYSQFQVNTSTAGHIEGYTISVISSC